MKAFNKNLKTFKSVSIFLLLVFMMTVLSGVVNIVFYKKAYPKKYESIVNQACIRYNLKPQLLYAIIKTESNFDPCARSSAEAVGLMQITEETFDWLQGMAKEKLPFEQLCDPCVNVNYGAMFLSVLEKKYFFDEVVLSAYNAGMTPVDKWLKDESVSSNGKRLKHIPYKETRNYVKTVIENQEMYERLYFKDYFWRMI